MIDVFTSRRFAGNPAAVVFDADGLSDRQMQAVAAEFNLSETTFVLSPESSGREDVATAHGASDLLTRRVRFRWFTPKTEVQMCGHATIAGVHALAEARIVGGPTEEGSGHAPLGPNLSIQTRGGTLRAVVEPRAAEGAAALDESGAGRWMIWLQLIDPTLESLSLDECKLATLLGLPPDSLDPALPGAKTQDGDGILFARDLAALQSAVPRFSDLGAFLTQNGLRGLSLATVNTLTPAMTVQSRFFAPGAGVDEDPVTGSVHGPLAAYLVRQGHCPMQDGVAALMCAQGMPGGRGGVVYALVRQPQEGRYSVRIGGHAVTTMRGTLSI